MATAFLIVIFVFGGLIVAAKLAFCYAVLSDVIPGIFGGLLGFGPSRKLREKGDKIAYGVQATWYDDQMRLARQGLAPPPPGGLSLGAGQGGRHSIGSGYVGNGTGIQIGNGGLGFGDAL